MDLKLPKPPATFPELPGSATESSRAARSSVDSRFPGPGYRARGLRAAVSLDDDFFDFLNQAEFV